MTISFTATWGRRAAALLLVATSLTVAAAQPAAASTALSGLVSVSYTTAKDDDSIKLATITCPDNKTVVGTGWSTNPSTAELRLQFLIPSKRTVMAQVHEDYTWYDYSWSLTVYAWCAETPQGWSLSSYKAASSSDSYHTAYAD